MCMLQVDNSTIFMFQVNLGSAKNLKFIMCMFEQLSGF
jgi:hypothetical protein